MATISHFRRQRSITSHRTVRRQLAGRLRVDIGAKTINNRDHALIYSDGVLAIGGRVDENGFATGQAQTLNNHSATIESAGDMALSVSQLNNINDHFSTEVALISTEQIHEYQHKGSPTRWSADEEGVFVDNNSADDLLNLNTPEDTGANNDNFTSTTTPAPSKRRSSQRASRARSSPAGKWSSARTMF